MTDIELQLDRTDPTTWAELVDQARNSDDLATAAPVPENTLEAVVTSELMTPDATAHIDHAADNGWITPVDDGTAYVLPNEDTTGIGHLLGEPDSDPERIRECLEATVEWYHDQLDPMIHRQWIKDKWGLSDDVIDRLRIGWVPEGDEVITHLRTEGFTDAEIARSGVVTSNALKHVYRCRADADCKHHDLPRDLDRLRDARLRDEIDVEDINPDAVIQRAVEEDAHKLYNWWDKRVTFPYLGEDGNIRYVIARETHATDDVEYGKYLKLQIRPHTPESVREPIYGVHRFEPGRPLVLTEGITDAIAAHANNIHCLSPVTKAFKQEHWPQLVEYAEQVPRVYLVFDAEKSGTGLEAALQTADHLAEEGDSFDVRIAELPRSEDEEKVDLCEYLRGDADANTLREEVLDGAVSPEEHPRYDDVVGDDEEDSGADADYDAPTTSDSRSTALYDLSIRQVVEQDGNHGVKLGYRGDNPISHVGDSHSQYFVYERYRGGRRARDFKSDHTYTPMTWLACAASEQGYTYANRSTKSPGGSLTEGEKFAAWMYAKDEGMIADDDPVPYGAMKHLADEYDLMQYPDDHSRSGSLPAATYNAVLNLICDEYGYDPGREPVGGEKDEKQGEAKAQKQTAEDDEEKIIASMMDDMLDS